MTQTITNLGEIGAAGAVGAVLQPIDLPILRDGGVWNLTGYSNPAIDVWELRTRIAIGSPGTIVIQDILLGVLRWTPAIANLPSGVYEARIRVSPNAGVDYEPSGLFRFAIGASANP